MSFPSITSSGLTPCSRLPYSGSTPCLRLTSPILASPVSTPAGFTSSYSFASGKTTPYVISSTPSQYEEDRKQRMQKAWEKVERVQELLRCWSDPDAVKKGGSIPVVTYEQLLKQKPSKERYELGLAYISAWNRLTPLQQHGTNSLYSALQEMESVLNPQNSWTGTFGDRLLAAAQVAKK